MAGALELPIFPLGDVVLFPDAAAPLHIFEPRYRQLTEAALADALPIGMVALRPGRRRAQGEPPVYAVGCAGAIARHRRLADGRFHLLLRATHRFRILGERPPGGERLYRIARAEPLPEAAGDAATAAALREQVQGLLGEIAGGDAPSELSQLARLSLSHFTNRVAQSLALPVAEKQALLEAGTLEERLRGLASALEFHIAARRAGAAANPPGTLH